MQIKGISEKIFSPVSNKKNDKTIANHTNPFGVSFNGNIITADVFEGARKSEVIEKFTQKGRLLMNTIIGSMNSVNQSISTRLNSIASFGNRMKQRGADAINFLRESKLIFTLDSAKDFMRIDLANNAYSVKNLMKRDVAELRNELENVIATRGV